MTSANLKKYICEFDGAWDLYQHRFELELKDEKKFFKKPVWTDQFIKDKRIYLYYKIFGNKTRKICHIRPLPRNNR